MTIPTDVKACIDKHLQAVRDNLNDKEESVQNEILEGLRDHINEAISRGGEPITIGRIESILAQMDDPSSYAEEPACVVDAAAKRAGRMSGNIWLYVAAVFLIINCIGVWKLFEIERKTGGGNNPGNVGTVGTRAAGNPLPKQAVGAPFRCAAFMENKEPVLRKADEPVVWLFSENVVSPEEVGKKLANPPLKMIPSMQGDYQWKSTKELAFIPKEEWRPNKSFKVELDVEFKTRDGIPYMGARVWSFRTIDFGLESVSLATNNGQFCFDMGFTMTPDRTSLGEKLKLFYVNADGESVPLDYTMVQQNPANSALVRTQIVPAISFLVRISPGLSADHWRKGTEETIEKKIQNSLTFSLNAAISSEKDPSNPGMILAFSKETSETDAGSHISISRACH